MRPLSILTLVVTLAAGFAAAWPAAAQDYARPGFYAGAGVVGGIYTKLDDAIEDQLGLDSHTDTAVGFDLFSGYRFHPNVAVETELTYLSATDVDVTGLGPVDIQSFALTGSAKIFPWTGRIQPYLLGGIGFFQIHVGGKGAVDNSELGFAARFGGGVDFYLTERLVLVAKADYLLPTAGDVEDADFVSFGGALQYRF